MHPSQTLPVRNPQQGVPVSESAKALAKREETSPAVSTVEAVLLSAKLCSFSIYFLQQTEGVFLPLPGIQSCNHPRGNCYLPAFISSRFV